MIIFKVLGPLEVTIDGHAVDVGRRRERLLLGLLAMHGGTAVHIDQLLRMVWRDEDPPRTARNSLQVSIHRLRARLGTHAAIVRRGEAYHLAFEPSELDLHRFRALVVTARHHPPRERMHRLCDAEQLWRGEVLADALDDEWRVRLFPGLGLERLAAVEDRLEAQFELGMHHQTIAELTALTKLHPTRERLADLRFRTVYRLGDKAGALAAFRLHDLGSHGPLPRPQPFRARRHAGQSRRRAG